MRYKPYTSQCLEASLTTEEYTLLSFYQIEFSELCLTEFTYKWFAKNIIFIGVENNTMIYDATACCYGNDDRIGRKTKNITGVYTIIIFCRRIYWKTALEFIEKSEKKTLLYYAEPLFYSSKNVFSKSIHLSPDNINNRYLTSPFSCNRKTGYTTPSKERLLTFVKELTSTTPAKSNEITTSPNASANVVFSGEQRDCSGGTEPTLITSTGWAGLVMSYIL